MVVELQANSAGVITEVVTFLLSFCWVGTTGLRERACTVVDLVEVTVTGTRGAEFPNKVYLFISTFFFLKSTFFLFTFCENTKT